MIPALSTCTFHIIKTLCQICYKLSKMGQTKLTVNSIKSRVDIAMLVYLSVWKSRFQGVQEIGAHLILHMYFNVLNVI